MRVFNSCYLNRKFCKFEGKIKQENFRVNLIKIQNRSVRHYHWYLCCLWFCGDYTTISWFDCVRYWHRVSLDVWKKHAKRYCTINSQKQMIEKGRNWVYVCACACEWLFLKLRFYKLQHMANRFQNLMMKYTQTKRQLNFNKTIARCHSN